ncbi:UDP-N-acetylglucosamine transferase subunit [Homalodisca vitripennis]|nr:UDP-N-acetylglucosamine transferase subunit [Homalodisca vitripennis]
MLQLYTNVLMVVLSFILVFIVRTILLMVFTVKGYRKKSKRLSQDSVKTVIVIGSGGHTSEMMYLVESLHPVRYSPRLYIMASSDLWSEQKVHELESKLKTNDRQSKYEVFKIPRSRSVHQSYFTSVFTTLYAILSSIPIMLKFNPELVLCNGPGTCIPICGIAFLMRCCFISDNKVVFVESICRVKTMSLSGRILQWFADEILVQWPELMSKCKRAKYIGRVV